MNETEKKTYQLHARLPAYRKKVQYSLDIVKKALNMDVNWIMSVSFGKDSLVMLDLVHQLKRIPVLYMDSDYKLPDVYEVVELSQEKYQFDFHKIYFAEKKPIQNVWETFGVPGIDRTPTMQVKAVKTLKKDAFDVWCKQNGYNGVFWGLRNQESKGRRWLTLSHGTTFETKNGFFRCSPLAYWSAKDIWAYIVTRDLPYPKLYDYQKFGYTRDFIRNTGWSTTDDLKEGRAVWLRHYYPDFYEKLIWMLPEIRRFT